MTTFHQTSFQFQVDIWISSNWIVFHKALLHCGLMMMFLTTMFSLLNISCLTVELFECGLMYGTVMWAQFDVRYSYLNVVWCMVQLFEHGLVYAYWMRFNKWCTVSLHHQSVFLLAETHDRTFQCAVNSTWHIHPDQCHVYKHSVQDINTTASITFAPPSPMSSTSSQSHYHLALCP